ncbi:MAG: hypothetical protein JKY71_02885 [Alphaproteobacteria bacterium]|nr:hypothetical protein [Alphaproteobacteria bacterium]
MNDKPSYKKREENRGGELKDYWPLFSLIMIAALAGLALVHAMGGGLMAWMHFFMGFFLCAFAMLKIFNLDGFSDGFAMYDIIAKRARSYGYVYPFIELALGLGYLSFIAPPLVYAATVIVMTVGTVGVISALRKGLDINCPCMGSVLDVPLSTVTLTEDIGMGAMALIMLFMAF